MRIVYRQLGYTCCSPIDPNGDLDGVVNAAGAAADRAGIGTYTLKLSTDGRRVFILEARSGLAGELIGVSLGCGVRHALAVQQAQDGDGSREGAAGLGHAAHARAESLENTKRAIGIKTQCRGKRAGDGLSAVESLFMVGGCLSLAGLEVEFGHIDGVHGYPFRWRFRSLDIVLAFWAVGDTVYGAAWRLVKRLAMRDNPMQFMG